MTEGLERLRELDLRPGYDSTDDALTHFYVPALGRAVSYGRSVGYFRSTSLSVAARGLSHFIAGGGRMRLLVGTDLTTEDRDAMGGRVSADGRLAERLAEELVPADEIAAARLEVLAWLVQSQRLLVRVAIPLEPDGTPSTDGSRYFHEKIGVLRDAHGDGIAFQGSINETARAWHGNFESFSVYRSWAEDRAHHDHWVEAFERRWAGRIPGWRVVPLPKALRDRLLDFLPPRPPRALDPEEPAPLGDPATVARYLLAAPRLVGSERLAEATSGTRLRPHQTKVVERLAGEYPRSWLLADEVGLGKTISAAIALRRLILQGSVRRVLVLAPASVCSQWHDELFERGALWASRYEAKNLLGAHPDDVTLLHDDQNPYAERDLLVVSSHLARRADHRERLIDAGPWDVLVVDEAHHARRRGGDPDEYRPGRLLELLDAVSERQAARAIWLLTATPMQVHPVELRDLLVHVGLQGPLAEPAAFERWARVLAPTEDEPPWSWLASMLSQSAPPPVGEAERSLLDEIEHRLGPADRARIEHFGAGDGDPESDAAALEPEGRSELRRWLRLRGPVGRALVRHTRDTLRAYRAAGVLDEPLPDRRVMAVPVEFTAAEHALYERLDTLIDRLQEAAGPSTAAGFVLTIYRRRLTSSWAAITRTLERRVARAAFDVGDETLVDELDHEELDDVGEPELVPLSPDDEAEIRRFIGDVGRVDDSKFDRLRHDLDQARDRGRAAIVFTQFTDTLAALRDRLAGIYRSELATFTGSGGAVWDDAETTWHNVSKQELVEAIRAGHVTVLLATDAASEGLNLQACSFVVNYDMPWNPMRVEQRIGRVDRLGQAEPVVEIRNYFVPGTVEERVYELLSRRIDDFSDLVGDLQPILGAAEAAVQEVFRSPRSERHRVEAERLADLDRRIDELREGGVSLDVDDPLPFPDHPPSPVTLEQLADLLPHLGARLGHPDRPSSTDPDRVSRDAEDWCSLRSYGHPDLVTQLEKVVVSAPTTDGALVIAEAEEFPVAAALRADRSPPERVHLVDQLGDLGSPVSTGDAERMAAEIARAAGDARLEHIRRTVAQRAFHRREALVRRFVLLVHRQITAECVLPRHATGDGPDPAAVWAELAADTATGWAYAETFRRLAGVERSELLPPSATDPDRMSPAEARRTTRSRTYADLDQIMREWREVS